MPLQDPTSTLNNVKRRLEELYEALQPTPDESATKKAKEEIQEMSRRISDISLEDDYA